MMEQLKDKAYDKAKETAYDAAKETAKDKAKGVISEKIPESMSTAYSALKEKADEKGVTDAMRRMGTNLGAPGGMAGDTGDRYRLDFRAFGWSFVAAGLSSTIAKTLVAPIEMMAGPTSHEVSVATQQGYMTYWRGNLSNVVRAFPNEGFNFALRDYFNGMMGIRDIDARREPMKYFWTSYTGGGLAGVVALAALYPIDAAYGSRLPTDISRTLTDELKLQGGSARGAMNMGREQLNAAADAAKGMAGSAKDMAKEMAKDMGQAAHKVADTARDMGSRAADTAREMGSRVTDTAKDMGHRVADTAKEAASKVSHGEFRGAAQTVASTVPKEGGLFGLYRGFVPSVTGAFVYRAAYFGAYDTVRAMNPEKNTFMWAWLMAQATTTASSYLAHPFDVIRYRMMHFRERYTNTWNCWAKTCNTEGYGALFRGSSANIVRSTGGALTLVVYDMMKKYMADKKMV